MIPARLAEETSPRGRGIGIALDIKKRPPTEAALLVFLGLDLLLLLHRGRPAAGGGKVLFVLMCQSQPRLRHVDQQVSALGINDILCDP
jgi:hypothetical protein